MAIACVTEELEASAEAVWKLIGDFGDMSAWAPDANIRTLDGSGVGAVRVIDSPVGVFKERCEAHDSAGLSFSYRLLESPFPFTDYVASVTLTPIDDAHCTIEWKGSFETEGMPAAEMAAGVEETYRDVFIATIRHTLAKRE